MIRDLIETVKHRIGYNGQVTLWPPGMDGGPVMIVICSARKWTGTSDHAVLIIGTRVFAFDKVDISGQVRIFMRLVKGKGATDNGKIDMQGYLHAADLMGLPFLGYM